MESHILSAVMGQEPQQEAGLMAICIFTSKCMYMFMNAEFEGQDPGLAGIHSNSVTHILNGLSGPICQTKVLRKIRQGHWLMSFDFQTFRCLQWCMDSFWKVQWKKNDTLKTFQLMHPSGWVHYWWCNGIRLTCQIWQDGYLQATSRVSEFLWPVSFLQEGISGALSVKLIVSLWGLENSCWVLAVGCTSAPERKLGLYNQKQQQRNCSKNCSALATSLTYIN